MTTTGQLFLAMRTRIRVACTKRTICVGLLLAAHLDVNRDAVLLHPLLIHLHQHLHPIAYVRCYLEIVPGPRR